VVLERELFVDGRGSSGLAAAGPVSDSREMSFRLRLSLFLSERVRFFSPDCLTEASFPQQTSQFPARVIY